MALFPKIIAILTLALTPCLGWTERGEAKEIERLYRSAYFLGRGDTGIAIADEEEAIFYNPAGVAYGKGIYKKTVLASPHLEVSQDTRDLIRQIGAEEADIVDTMTNHIGKPQHVGAYNFTGLIFRRAALGAFTSANINTLVSKSPKEGGLEEIGTSINQANGITFTVAESFFKGGLLIGGTAKYLQKSKAEISLGLSQAETLKNVVKEKEKYVGFGYGGGGDFGMMLRGGKRLRWGFGLTVKDIGDTNITPEQESSVRLNVKQTVNAGFSLAPHTRFSSFRILFDYHDIASAVETNTFKKIHIGTELTVKDMIGFTAGLNQGYPTGGLYADLYFMRLDIGGYTEEVGDRVGTRPDARYYFRLKVGF